MDQAMPDSSIWPDCCMTWLISLEYDKWFTPSTLWIRQCLRAAFGLLIMFTDRKLHALQPASCTSLHGEVQGMECCCMTLLISLEYDRWSHRSYHIIGLQQSNAMIKVQDGKCLKGVMLCKPTVSSSTMPGLTFKQEHHCMGLVTRIQTSCNHPTI